MTRHDDAGFDQRIADWLEADPDRAPRDLMRVVEHALPSIPQRRVFRLPFRSVAMNRTVLILAAALLLAALGAGAYTVGSQRPTLAPVPSVAPAAPDSSAGSVTAYVRARDAVCDAGMAARAPLETRYTRIWTTGVTDAEFADGVAALRDFVTLDRGVESDLLALDVPPELLRDHVAFVTRLDDVILMITNELSLIDAGNLAGAQAVDLATDPMSQKMNAFETRNGLRACP